MIVIPTTELRGSLVYAPGASGSRTPVDAGGTTRALAALGFRQMHIHDLDADSGRDQNEALIAEIARDASLEVVVSGGALSEDRIDRLIESGVTHVIVAPSHDDDIDTVARLAEGFPARLIVRVDLGDPLFSRRNGRRPSSADMIDLANELSDAPIGGLAIHGISSAGFPAAPLRSVEDLVEAAEIPVFYRTEVSSVGELRALEHLGVAATMLGSSLFNGQLDAQAVAHHFES